MKPLNTTFFIILIILALNASETLNAQTPEKGSIKSERKFDLKTLLGYNPDEGVGLGFKNIWTNKSIKSNSFNSQHILKGSYFSATNGLEFNYASEFSNVIKNWSFGFKSIYTTPNYTKNFFGFDNNSANPYANDRRDLDYNQVKIRTFILGSSLIWRSFKNTKIDFTINYQSFKIDRTTNRYITNRFNKNSSLFSEQNYINSEVNYSYSDKGILRNLGIIFKVTSGFTSSINNGNNFGYLISDFSVDYKLISSGRIVLASKVKGHLTLGNNFEFFQAASIGGNNGLRGYRNERFTGKSAWFHSSDIRFLLKDVKTSSFPLKFGVYTGFDYGKVYANDFLINPSFIRRWANIAYGGGLFFNSSNKLKGNVSLFDGNDDLRFAITLNYNF